MASLLPTARLPIKPATSATSRTVKTVSPMPAVKAYAQKDENVGGLVTGLMQSNNPLMKQATTAGLQMGQKRGMLNSSMSVGAAQGEAYKVASDLGKSQASINAAANLANQNYLEQRSVTEQTEAGLNVRSDAGNLSAEGIAARNNDAAMDRTTASNTSSEGIAAANNKNSITVTGLNNKSSAAIAAAGNKSSAAIAAAGNKSSAAIAAANNRSSEKTTAANNKSAETIKANDLAWEEKKFKLDAATLKLIENKKIDSGEKAQLSTSLANADREYNSTITAINSNKDLKGPARGDQIRAAQLNHKKTIDVQSGLFDIKIDWPLPKAKKKDDDDDGDDKKSSKKSSSKSSNPPPLVRRSGNNSNR